MKTGGERGPRGGESVVSPDSPQTSPNSAPAGTKATRPWRAKSRARRRLLAIRATEGEIVVPPFTPLGYLAQSKLIGRAQQGDAEALRAVWANNVRLVFTVLNGLGVGGQWAADAFQDAQFGLRRAVLGFRVHDYYSFSTYAYAAMHKAVIRSRSGHRFGLEVPAGAARAYAEFVARVVHAPSRAHWFDARDAYLSTAPARYARLLFLHSMVRPESLRSAVRQPAGLDGPAAPLLRDELRKALRRAVTELSKPLRVVLEMRFGLGDTPAATLQAVGDSLGVSKERARQLETQALGAVRQALHEAGWECPTLV